MHFWYRWPSWQVELVGGGALAILLQPLPSWGPLKGQLFRFTIGTAISFGYERFIDVNGWSWSDVGQRAVGIATGLAICYVARKLLKI